MYVWGDSANWDSGVPASGTENVFVDNGSIAAITTENAAAQNLYVGLLPGRWGRRRRCGSRAARTSIAAALYVGFGGTGATTITINGSVTTITVTTAASGVYTLSNEAGTPTLNAGNQRIHRLRRRGHVHAERGDEHGRQLLYLRLPEARLRPTQHMELVNSVGSSTAASTGLVGHVHPERRLACTRRANSWDFPARACSRRAAERIRWPRLDGDGNGNLYIGYNYGSHISINVVTNTIVNIRRVFSADVHGRRLSITADIHDARRRHIQSERRQPDRR